MMNQFFESVKFSKNLYILYTNVFSQTVPFPKFQYLANPCGNVWSVGQGSHSSDY